MPVPTLLVKPPTAMQIGFDGQETPPNELFVAPAGLGVGWITHRLPFRRSARVTSKPVRLLKNPTAVEELGDAHDTPISWTYLAPSG